MYSIMLSIVSTPFLFVYPLAGGYGLTNTLKEDSGMEDNMKDTAGQLEGQENDEQEAQGQEQQGRTFTAEEVEEIVKRRLARDRKARGAGQSDGGNDGDDQRIADREAAVSARELNVMAREVLLEEGMPTKLADILNYSDEKTLREMIEELKNLNPSLSFERNPYKGKAWAQRMGGSPWMKSPDASTRKAMGLQG